VDTTVREAIAPSDRCAESLTGRSRSWSPFQAEGSKLAELSALRPKRAAIMVGRYTHAHPFTRARPNSNSCAPARRISAMSAADRGQSRARRPLGPDARSRAAGSAFNEQRQRATQVYSLHAPRWSASAKARPGRLTRSAARSRVSPGDSAQGRAVSVHTKHYMATPYDGHTRGPVIRSRKVTGVAVRRIHAKRVIAPQISRPLKGMDLRIRP